MNMPSAYILGIESSCDETAAAVVRSGEQLISNVVASQIATHQPYGGVVPELASREHLRAIVPVVRQALADAKRSYSSIDAIAVTQGPGLAGALLVGISYACTCVSNMCTNIPADGNYYLTSFCDKSVACGAFSGNCNEFYCADYKRFGCHNMITCCQSSKCVNLKVIDGGPSCGVENSAGRPVIDASYSACKTFTGRTGCGWSDHVAVNCKRGQLERFQMMSEAETAPLLGLCSYNATVAAAEKIPMCVGEFY